MVCILTALFSYAFKSLYPIAIACSISLAIAILIDLLACMFRAFHLNAYREMSLIGVIRASNEVNIRIENTANSSYKTKFIDETPIEIRNEDQELNISIKAKSLLRAQYQYYPLQRGSYTFNRLLFFVPGYFGLLLNRAKFNQTEVITVLPNQKMHPQDSILLSKNSQFNGEKIIRQKGQSFEFDQINEYVPGDDLRYINWAATARSNQLKLNRYVEEKSHNLYFILDKGRTMNYENQGLTLLDFSINASAHLAQIAIKQGDKVGTLVFSNKLNAVIKAQKNPSILNQLLNTWGVQTYKTEHSNYTTLYTACQKTILQRSLLFLFTNFDTFQSLHEQINVFRKLNQRHMLVVVFFKDNELENFTHSAATSYLDSAAKTIARQVFQNQLLIKRELEKHKIKVILCHPTQLATMIKNTYTRIKQTNSL